MSVKLSSDRPVVAIVEARARAGERASLLGFFADTVGAARGFEGCLGVDVLLSDDDADVVTLIERWASPAHLTAYRAWRQNSGTGAAGAGARFMTGPPTSRLFELTDV
jgi:quinol monooxygenase YgiN